MNKEFEVRADVSCVTDSHGRVYVSKNDLMLILYQIKAGTELVKTDTLVSLFSKLGKEEQ